MEKGKYSQQAIMPVEHESLSDLFDIRADIVVRQHDALGIACAPAGKNNGGKIVELPGRALAKDFDEPASWYEPCEKK